MLLIIKKISSIFFSQQISQGKPSGDGLSVATTQQNLRALDALSCVAAEKQVCKILVSC